jgi:SP family general alpha glucoside:H+ symporter-like MFS transporter
MSAEIQTAPHNLSEKNNVEHVGDIKSDEANFRADAMEAENLEHNMTVMQAVKAYPMACLWAFIMSSTIVSPSDFAGHELTFYRSWKPIVSS